MIITLARRRSRNTPLQRKLSQRERMRRRIRERLADHRFRNLPPLAPRQRAVSMRFGEHLSIR